MSTNHCAQKLLDGTQVTFNADRKGHKTKKEIKNKLNAQQENNKTGRNITIVK